MPGITNHRLQQRNADGKRLAQWCANVPRSSHGTTYLTTKVYEGSAMSLNIEHIDLIPHPMDAWRAALDALIACAPGDACDIAWHLADSQVQVQLLLDRTPATPGVETLVDRLMLIAAGRMIGASRTPRHNEHGFTHQAQFLGSVQHALCLPLHQPSHQPGAALSGVHEAQTELPASSSPASTDPAPHDLEGPASLRLQPNKAMHEQGHVSAPRSAASELHQRPSGDSSCQ